MDSQKTSIPKKTKVTRKVITKTKTLLMNYLLAKTTELKKDKFILFKDFLINRKEHEINFNINEDMGFKIPSSDNSGNYLTYSAIALGENDLKLFSELLDLGLADKYLDGTSLWRDILLSEVDSGFLEEYFSRRKFLPHFLEGGITPLHLALKHHKQLAFKVIINHPDFDLKFLSYEEPIYNFNSLLVAASEFDLEAVKILLDLEAPFTNRNQTTTLFDELVEKYLDFFSKDKVTPYLKKRAGLRIPFGYLEEERGGGEDLFPEERMSNGSVVKLFYLALNRTPHQFNKHQLVSDCFKKPKGNIFNILDEILENVKVDPKAVKLFLDVILSVGPGITFNLLPAPLKRLYTNRPHLAEMVMPIVLPDYAIKYIYTYEEFKNHISNNLENFFPIRAFTQYIEQSLDTSSLNEVTKDHFKELETIFLNSSKLDSVEQKIVWPDDRRLSDILTENPIEILKKIPHSLNVNFNIETFGRLLDNELDILKSIGHNLVGDDFFKYNNDKTYFDSVIQSHTYLIPRLYVQLVRLNELLSQIMDGGRIVSSDNEVYDRALAIFCRYCLKIDFYTLIWLHHDLIIKKSSPSELINLLVNLISSLQYLNKKGSLGGDLPDFNQIFFRLKYFIYGLLADAYRRNNEPDFALTALKEAMLIIEKADNRDLFKEIYKSQIHHELVMYIFEAIIDLGLQHYSPKALYPHLRQVLSYEEGMILSEKIYHGISNYFYTCIEHNLFSEVGKLLRLVNKRFPVSKLEAIHKANLDKIKLHLFDIYIKIDQFELIELVNKIDLEMRCMVIDFQGVDLSPSFVKKHLPEGVKLNNKIAIIENVHLYDEFEIDKILDDLQKIKQADLKAKKQKQEQEQEENKLENKLPDLSLDLCSVQHEQEDLVHCLSYLSLYNHQQNSKPKPKKQKPIKTIAQSESNPLLFTPIKPAQEKFNRSELKNLANIGNDYSDLIMISSIYGEDNRRFLAIKKSSEFECFFKVCHQSENHEGEWAVKSVNPYGVNQHGVKLYENKTKPVVSGDCLVSKLKTEQYLIKIKGSGSERAVGVGKELDYKGQKIIIYIVDTILTHKKADRALKL